MLLDSHRNIKIVDFGLSNTYKPEEKLKTACGSPCYAAPEMIAGKKYVGLRVDLWSAGVVLFTLLCGYLPFEDPNTAELYKKILGGEFTIPDFVSPRARELLKGILNTDPEKRFTISDIRQSSWYSNMQTPRPRQGIIVGVHQIPIEPRVLSQVLEFGFDPEYTQKCIEANKHNGATTLYYMLMQRFLREGGKSAADLSSDLYQPITLGQKLQSLRDLRPEQSKNSDLELAKAVVLVPHPPVDDSASAFRSKNGRHLVDTK